MVIHSSINNMGKQKYCQKLGNENNHLADPSSISHRFTPTYNDAQRAQRYLWRDWWLLNSLWKDLWWPSQATGSQAQWKRMLCVFNIRGHSTQAVFLRKEGCTRQTENLSSTKTFMRSTCSMQHHIKGSNEQMYKLSIGPLQWCICHWGYKLIPQL